MWKIFQVANFDIQLVCLDLFCWWFFTVYFLYHGIHHHLGDNMFTFSTHQTGKSKFSRTQIDNPCYKTHPWIGGCLQLILQWNSQLLSWFYPRLEGFFIRYQLPNLTKILFFNGLARFKWLQIRRVWSCLTHLWNVCWMARGNVLDISVSAYLPPPVSRV